MSAGVVPADTSVVERNSPVYEPGHRSTAFPGQEQVKHQKKGRDDVALYSMILSSLCR